MVNKNLRSVFYYITGVTVVCLMIEVTKNRANLLESTLYVVQTAKDSELATVPSKSSSDTLTEDDDIIPKRNRGRRPPVDRNEKKSSERTDVDDNEVEKPVNEKEKFREWKSSLKLDPDEVGLFKKWKKLRGLTKKQQNTSDQEDNSTNFSDIAIEEEDNEIDDEEENSRDEYINNQEINNVDDFKPQRKAAKPRTEAKPQTEAKPHNESKEQVDTKSPTESKENKIRKEGKGNPNNTKLNDDYEDKSEEDKLDLDYPEGITVYHPPTTEHNCMNFTFTDELLERKNQVKRSCENLQDEIGKQRRLYSRLRWAVPERLLYCPVFKAASTSWLSNYLKLVNSTADPKSGNLHKTVTNLFPPPANFKLRKTIYEESVKFIIVRHPFERLVSAYRDKLAGFSRNDHYLSMRSHIISNYRKNSTDKSTIPTFSESVDFILDELAKIDTPARERQSLIDGHFIPYSRRCLPCEMDYDVIIKFETLSEDSRYLINQCGLSDQLEVKHENRAPSGPRTKQGYKNKSNKVKHGEDDPEDSNGSSFQTLDFFQDIPKSKIKQLYEHYRHDFLIFGFSPEEYL